MFSNRFFRTVAGIISILIIIVLALQIPYITNNFRDIVTVVLFPLLMAGFFYYLLRPVVRFLHERIKSKNLSILITFIGMLILIFIITYFGGSIIYTEIRRLMNFLADYEMNGGGLSRAIEQIEELDFLGDFDVGTRITEMVRDLANRISNYDFLGAFASLTQVGLILLLIPFLVIYFLKDDSKLAKGALNIVPNRRKDTAKEIMKAVDTVFGIYIPSQLLVGMISGCIMFVGYLIIGIPNPVGLAIMLAVASVIPFLGPALGVLPAVFIALTTSLEMLVQVGILMTIVQQFEGNIIRPILQGGKLKLHPVVVIFVVLVGTVSFGILGALFSVPIFESLRRSLKILYQSSSSAQG